MSGGAITQQTLRRLMRLALPDVARRDVMAALEAARQDPLLQLLYEAGHEAGLRDTALLDRAAGCFCAYAAGNVADDLVDGDCDYLEPAVRLAPTVQWILQHLATVLLVEGGVPAPALAGAAERWARAAGPQQVEVRTTSWTADVFRLVAAVASEQWAAHLTALWSATPLALLADDVGRAMGFAAHVAEDVRSRDRRFGSMPAADRAAIVEDAERALGVLERSGLRAARFVVEAVRPALRQATIEAWYDDKTRRILDRYGPGPRVHYHTGLVKHADDASTLPRRELRRRLVEAQEALVYESLDAWGLTTSLADLDVLDCGCGLGGTSILLAEAGARVTALTVCAPHVEIVRDFAVRAGVGRRVDARWGDANALEGEPRYDVVIAIESSSYFDRRAFFSSAARVLRPGGRVLVVDLFAGRPEAKPGFDEVWKTDIGTLAEYDDAAAAAGFTRTGLDDLSARGARFWDLTQRDTSLSLAATTDDAERARLLASLESHRALQRGLSDGSLQHLRVAWTLPDAG